MRKPLCQVSVTREFGCEPRVVWEALTTKESYKRWYGLPQAEQLESVSPSFCVGARLTFANRAMSKIITELRAGSIMVLSDNRLTEEFLIEQTDTGCRVSLSVAAHREELADEKALSERVELVLAALGKCAESFAEKEKNSPDTDRKNARRHVSSLDRAMARIFMGYKLPEETTSEGALHRDFTEQDVKLSLPGVLFAGVLCVLFMFTLMEAVSFERSDIVASSGLSVTESELVSADSACEITFDITKKQLEQKLSCVGERLSADEYRYSSIEKTASGEAAKQIFVVYDAYGRVRRYAFKDAVRSAVVLTPRIVPLEGVVSADMQPREVEKALGYSMSALVCDKQGLTNVFFGSFDSSGGIFGGRLSAELVVTLDTASKDVSCGYYAPHSAETAFAHGELSAALRRQFAENAEYESTVLAARRTYLLYGKTQAEFETVLGVAGREYRANERETAISFVCPYTLADGTGASFTYDAVFVNERAASVSFVSDRLSQLSRDTLSGIGIEYIRTDMRYNDAARLLGIAPTAVRIDRDTVALFYGAYLDGERQDGALDDYSDYNTEKTYFPLELTVDLKSLRIARIIDNTELGTV